MDLLALFKKPFERMLHRSTSKFVVSTGPDAYRFFYDRWPQLKDRIPDDLQFRNMARLCVLASDIAAPIWKWTYTRGGSNFLCEDVPNPYVACLGHNRGNVEFLMVMWRQGSRRFWFCDQFVVFQGGESGDFLKSHVSLRLNEALDRWDQGCDTVIYSGYFGWFDAKSGSWEMDEKLDDSAEFDEAEIRLRERLSLKWKGDVGGV